MLLQDVVIYSVTPALRKLWPRMGGNVQSAGRTCQKVQRRLSKCTIYLEYHYSDDPESSSSNRGSSDCFLFKTLAPVPIHLLDGNKSKLYDVISFRPEWFSQIRSKFEQVATRAGSKDITEFNRPRSIIAKLSDIYGPQKGSASSASSAGWGPRCCIRACPIESTVCILRKHTL